MSSPPVIAAKAHRHVTELVPPVREILQPPAGALKGSNHRLHKAIGAMHVGALI